MQQTTDKGYTSYLGIDWGEKRIGLAMGDDSTRMASPFGVVADLDEVLQVIADEEIDVLVVGMPMKMRDQSIALDPRFEAFISELESRSGLELIRIDERLTSKHADSLIGDKKSKAARDAVAAMLILQAHLDQIA